MRKLFPLAAIVLILAGCSKAPRRVLVLYPEHWDAGEPRNCILLPPAQNSVSETLSSLDCDRGSGGSLTPRSRMFTMDVSFDGQNPQAEIWTCQRSKVASLQGLKGLSWCALCGKLAFVSAWTRDFVKINDTSLAPDFQLR
jgi:hypothetical protein